MLKVYDTPIFTMRSNLNNNNFFIKREDLLPISFGGNKVRIACEYFEDMLSKNYDCIITYGSTQSNLNRVVANMSNSIGIPCYVVSPIEKRLDKNKKFNEKLVKRLGAKIIYCEKTKVAETIKNVFSDCETQGLRPYYIYGDEYGKGNELTPLQAYRKVYREIQAYEKENNIFFDYIFHASGTGMTQAGVICGSIDSKDDRKIIGISIARPQEQGIEAIKEIINSCLPESKSTSIHFFDKYLAGGYGKTNTQIYNTIFNIFSKEGIALDKTYTGKAYWGMTEYIKENNIINSKILFIHTGGTPLFFDDLNQENERRLE